MWLSYWLYGCTNDTEYPQGKLWRNNKPHSEVVENDDDAKTSFVKTLLYADKMATIAALHLIGTEE